MLGPGAHAGTASALLVILDAALVSEVDNDATTGLASSSGSNAGVTAAVDLNDLLVQHRLTWDDVVEPGSRLAKLCGRLGSTYEAERKAAYYHASRLIRRRLTTWSNLVVLPMALDDVADTPPLAISSPEHDWMTTVKRLKDRLAWRSEAEHIRMDAVERNLCEGRGMPSEDAKWLRDVWWSLELNDPDHEQAAG